MNKDRIHLVNKIFNNETIRTVWDKEQEKYYISVVDIVGVITESKDERKYWNKLKQRLKEEGNETVTSCHQLKLRAQDGKYRLTDVWNEHGVSSEKEYAILTNEIYKEWSGMTANEYKLFKGLRKESLRDNMSDIEVALADLGEIATREIAKKKNPKGLDENIDIARRGGKIASNTRKDLENEIGESVVSNNNSLDYKYTLENQLIIDKKC